MGSIDKDIKDYPITKDGKHIGDLRNGMVLTELAFASLSSALAVDQHQRNDSHGTAEITRDIDTAARAARAAREAVEQITGQPCRQPRQCHAPGAYAVGATTAG
jgi:hypothetical protein